MNETPPAVGSDVSGATIPLAGSRRLRPAAASLRFGVNGGLHINRRWMPQLYVDELGRDWFNHEDGRHYFQFPPEVLTRLGQCRGFETLLYDEPEHMQNSANMFAQLPAGGTYTWDDTIIVFGGQ